MKEARVKFMFLKPLKKQTSNKNVGRIEIFDFIQSLVISWAKEKAEDINGRHVAKVAQMA